MKRAGRKARTDLAENCSFFPNCKTSSLPATAVAVEATDAVRDGKEHLCLCLSSARNTNLSGLYCVLVSNGGISFLTFGISWFWFDKLVLKWCDYS